MTKQYTEEELLALRTTAVVPTAVDFAEFTKAIEEQRALEQSEEHDVSGRRRSSHGGMRPVFRARAPKPKVIPQPDEDGWVTLNKKKASISGEDATQSRDEFRKTTEKTTAVKVRPNNKNISSSKPADARDITADKPKTAFNAFAALDSEDESDESEEDDE